jgi:arsenite methyltransferase
MLAKPSADLDQIVLRCTYRRWSIVLGAQEMSEVREAVRERYARAAERIGASEDCCGDACGTGYDQAELLQVGMAPGASLGCGNPTLLADLHPGERVLDLGSGAGLDVLLSARRVGPGGHAYGVDMTDQMLRLAEANRASAGVQNATFLRGSIEAVPLPDAAVDVVISNCVINLSEDKAAVLREAFRVLRAGGRLAVADVVELEPLPEAQKRSLDEWAGCVAGTIPVDAYRGLLGDAGFEDVHVDVHREHRPAGGPGRIGSAYIRARRPAS